VVEVWFMLTTSGVALTFDYMVCFDSLIWTEHNSENLNFHLAVMDFRRAAVNPTELLHLAVDVVERFIKPTGNVRPVTLQRLRVNFVFVH
jgi:hypothetical protein